MVLAWTPVKTKGDFGRATHDNQTTDLGKNMRFLCTMRENVRVSVNSTPPPGGLPVLSKFCPGIDVDEIQTLWDDA